GRDLRATRRGLLRVASFPGSSVERPARGKDAYFAALKGSRRHALRKKLRRSAARVDIRIEIIQGPDGRTLDALFGLFWQTYQKATTDRKSTRLNSSHLVISYAVFCLKKKKKHNIESGERGSHHEHA